MVPFEWPSQNGNETEQSFSIRGHFNDQIYYLFVLEKVTYIFLP